MRALCWHGKSDVRVDTVPDPKIEDPRDVIIKVTSTCICGSDLHLYDGLVPTMESGDILGHEPMGEVVEVGKDIRMLRKGDRVVVPFVIACGECWYCRRGEFSQCDRSNPNAEMARKMLGQSPAAFFGYSHMMGAIPGGQAEYLRVPYADVGPIKIPDGLPDEKVVFLSDIFPTGYMGAENAQIQPGDTVAIWGCGPVGLFTILSAWMFGAGRVVAIDTVPERLAMAQQCKAEIIDFQKQDVHETLMEMTKGRGPDSCIDAVGAEAHGAGGLTGAVDTAKAALGMTSDRTTVLHQAIMACRKGGTVSIPGVYIGFQDRIPMGPAMNKALTFKMGQTHVQRYAKPLLEKIQKGEIDPGFVITHKLSLDEAPEAYKMFRDKKDGCVKVVLHP